MEQGIDFALKKDDLDAVLFPSYIGSTICAKAGYPSIAVPAGFMKSGGPFRVTMPAPLLVKGY
ncbi:Asp-tRNA(Asn)/Glu-tRNA(Gln) amidotransferase A subunit family amidase [Peribacillus simplex]